MVKLVHQVKRRVNQNHKRNLVSFVWRVERHGKMNLSLIGIQVIRYHLGFYDFLFLKKWLFLDDFRLFCGDLGNEVNDDVLTRAFNKYPSFQKARVVRDKRSGKTRGFGFVSFKDSQDYIRAMREMNGKISFVSDNWNMILFFRF